MLQVARGSIEGEAGPSADNNGLDIDFMKEPTLNEPLDWTSWNDLLQM